MLLVVFLSIRLFYQSSSAEKGAAKAQASASTNHFEKMIPAFFFTDRPFIIYIPYTLIICNNISLSFILFFYCMYCGGKYTGAATIIIIMLFILLSTSSSENTLKKIYSSSNFPVLNIPLWLLPQWKKNYATVFLICNVYKAYIHIFFIIWREKTIKYV